MKVKKQEQEDNKISFTIEDITPAYANMLRRFMMEEVPVMAIENVEFKKNNSILYDEIIAHRLGLIPLSTDLKSYELPESQEDIDEKKAKYTLILTLKEKGEKTVYASDLNSKDPKVKPVFDKMPIVDLLKGQNLEFEATAVLGKGKEHTKWSPCLAWYSPKANIKVNNSSSKFDEFKDKYPSQIFDKDNKIDKDLIKKFNLIDAVDGICDDIIKVEHEEDAYVFNIESWQQLSCKEIATTAIDIFQERLDELSEIIKQ